MSMQIAHQLGELFLGAVPTVIIFLFFFLFLRWAFFTPIQKAMTERKRLIEGARAEAATVEAAAKQELDTYTQALRSARAEVYKAREQRVKQWSAERDGALEAARKAAGLKVAQARTELDAEAAQARQSIQASAGDLANQVVRAVLPAAAGGSR